MDECEFVLDVDSDISVFLGGKIQTRKERRDLQNWIVTSETVKLASVIIEELTC